MSNAKANMLGTATHYTVRQGFDAPASLCADTACRHATTDRSKVTCKRCLASLAKRDRAFQRKSARASDASRESYMANCRYRMTPSAMCRALDAARAIAREEGSAL